jgi:DNA repair exonuclease SbcCD ATPase subunit
VELQGEINSVPFSITRVKTKTRGSLTFVVDGVDQSRQTTKETQQAMEEVLGVEPQMLSRCIFQDQFQLNGLLEASDVKFKDELSHVVPLEIWQHASSDARKQARNLAKRISESDGKISIRQGDLRVIEHRRDTSRTTMDEAFTKYRTRQTELEFQLSTLPLKIESLMVPSSSSQGNIGTLQELLDHTSQDTKHKEQDLTRLIRDKEESLKDTNSQLLLTERLAREMQGSVATFQRSLDQADSQVRFSESNWESLQERWGLDRETGENLDNEETTENLISTCPTCHQPLSENHQAHEDLAHKMAHEIAKAQEERETSQQQKEETAASWENESVKLKTVVAEVDSLAMRLQDMELSWEERAATIRQDINNSRELQSRRSADVAAAASRLETLSQLRNAEAKATMELSQLKQVAIAAENVSDGLNEELQTMTETVHGLELERNDMQRNETIMTQLVDILGARGVQTYVLQNAVDALQYASQSYLDELSDGQQRLELTLEAGDRIAKTTYIREQDEWCQRPLSSLSGGQWRRASLAVALGFAEIVSRRGRLKSSLLVLDEPLTHLDEQGRDHVGKVLRQLVDADSSSHQEGRLQFDTILIILQDLAAEELDACFDSIDEVQKHQGSSTVNLDTDKQ